MVYRSIYKMLTTLLSVIVKLLKNADRATELIHLLSCPIANLGTHFSA